MPKTPKAGFKTRVETQERRLMKSTTKYKKLLLFFVCVKKLQLVVSYKIIRHHICLLLRHYKQIFLRFRTKMKTESKYIIITSYDVICSLLFESKTKKNFLICRIFLFHQKRKTFKNNKNRHMMIIIIITIVIQQKNPSSFQRRQSNT